MKQTVFFLLLFFCPLSAVYAQMAMGAWKTHFSYSNVKEVAESKEKVYAISNGFLFSVDKHYESVEIYSKINGLSDGEIVHIAYSKENDVLFIAYVNSNIDILKGKNIINISDLKRKEISGKEINSISFYKQYAYLACGFGIVVFDVKKNEIADTYIIGEEGKYINVKSVQTTENNIYALTEEGIYYADSRNKNLSNFENWQRLPNPLDNDSVNKAIAAFNNELILLTTNEIYRFNDTGWRSLFRSDIDFSQIHVSGENITFFRDTAFIRFDKNWKKKENRILYVMADLAYSDEEDAYWIVYQSRLIKYKDGSGLNSFAPEGPSSKQIVFVKHRNGKLIAGSGGPHDIPSTPGNVQIYENGKWISIRQNGFPPGIMNSLYPFYDVMDAELDPLDPRRMYVATWRSLFEFYDNQLVKHYTEHNTTLAITDDSGGSWWRIILDGISFDKDNNLWVMNMTQSNDLLRVKKADGTWTSVHYGNLTGIATAKELFFSRNGYKWILIPRIVDQISLVVIDDKGTPFITSDDNFRRFYSFWDIDGNEVIPATFRSIAEDQNGIIWVGTDIGPLLIKPENVFYNDFTIDRIKLTREDNENLADYLLGSETINAIIVDGGNRKWIATASSGVYLLSPDGKETIHHFTVENSPLTSNTIFDLALDEETGELFIASSSALFSYKSDAAKGKTSYSDVHVYPNPVRAGYNGVITVSGLMEKSIVRITDLEGNLVWQGVSNGGIFTWNGKSLNGRRVGSGVYLVFAALEDGSEKMATKIAIIN